jgi:hypothetical protein
MDILQAPKRLELLHPTLENASTLRRAESSQVGRWVSISKFKLWIVECDVYLEPPEVYTP